MVTYINNEKLLIHYFQDKLSGASMKWYMGLEKICIRSWQDLADTFLKQYKYNLYMEPYHRQIHNISHKEKDPFKEYAQCYRKLVAYMEPPLAET